MSIASSFARLFPTTHRAARRIAAKRRQTIAVVLDEAVKFFEKAQHPQHPFGNHGPATDRNVEGAPTPVQSAHQEPPSPSCDSTQHKDGVGAKDRPIQIQSPTIGEETPN